MAVYVPNTNTYALIDVVGAVEDHAGELPGDDSLDGCFDYAESNYFDPLYNDNAYAPANSLKRFRNYGYPEVQPTLFVPDGFSPNGDGVHDYFEIKNLEYYPNHVASVFAPPSGCNCGGDTFSGGKLIYRRTNDYHLFPWDGTFINDCPVGTYLFVLEIDGSVHTSKTIFLAR